MMKLRLARPDWLIDINDITELRHITVDGDQLRVGALTRHADLLASDVVAQLFPMIHDAEMHIADPVVRNRGTIGGSLGQADPAEDLTTVCDVLRAQVFIATRGGERAVDIHQFHRGPYETACEQHELLTEIRFPIRPRSGSAYEKVERRVGDWAGAAAGAALWMAEDGTVADAPIGLTAVGAGGGGPEAPAAAAGRTADATTGLPAVGLEGLATEAAAVLVGERPSEDLFAEAADLARAACAPIEDQRGPVDYKRHLAGELTRRVLTRALDRAAHSTAVPRG